LRLGAASRQEADRASVWHGLQEAEPGTPLPAEFPHRATLAAAGYTAMEDLDGADVDELVDLVGLRRAEATSVIAAMES
jgi:hypothetical protein